MSEQYCLFDEEQAAEELRTRAAGGGRSGDGITAAVEKRKESESPQRFSGTARWTVGPYKADERAHRGWRGPAPGMRFLRIGLADRSSNVVETKFSMFELSNELRSKAKVALTLADGRGVEVKSLDVAYLENVYRVPV